MLITRKDISVAFSWSLKILLILLFIFSTFQEQFPLNITVLIAIFLSFSPTMVEKNFRYHFPIGIDTTLTLVLLLDSTGRVFNIYGQYQWYDIIMHLLGTSAISLVAFYVMFSFLYLKKIKLPYWAIAIFTFCIALTIGVLWEIGEFHFDRLTGIYHTYLDEPNSIRDMQWNIVGGLSVAVLGDLYLKKKLGEKRGRLY